MMIKTINPSVFLKQGASGLEQMIRVAVSCSENIANAELTAEYAGEIIGRQKYDLREGENNLEFFIPELPVTKKVLFKLFN